MLVLFVYKNDKQMFAESGAERDFYAKMEAKTSLGIDETHRKQIKIDQKVYPTQP